jgi:hypothetical protein
MYSKVRNTGIINIRFICNGRGGKAMWTTFEEVMTAWARQAGGGGYCGERISISENWVKEWKDLPGDDTGREYHVAYDEPVTWPWVDLYLRLRAGMPKKNRVSIVFG